MQLWLKVFCMKHMLISYKILFITHGKKITPTLNSHVFFFLCLWWVMDEKTIVWIWAQEQKLGTENITWNRKTANVGEAGNKDASSCPISVLWSLLKKPKCKLTWHINKEYKYCIRGGFLHFLIFFEQHLETKVIVT